MHHQSVKNVPCFVNSHCSFFFFWFIARWYFDWYPVLKSCLMITVGAWNIRRWKLLKNFERLDKSSMRGVPQMLRISCYIFFGKRKPFVFLNIRKKVNCCFLRGKIFRSFVHQKVLRIFAFFLNPRYKDGHSNRHFSPSSSSPLRRFKGSKSSAGRPKADLPEFKKERKNEYGLDREVL